MAEKNKCPIGSKLLESPVYKEWKKNHQDSRITHYFCALDKDFEIKNFWEIGVYIPKDDKITVFVLGEKVTKKEEDLIFKKEGDNVEELSHNEVKLSFDEALKIFRENYLKLFPKAMLGDGFVVLQTIEGKTLWNFTFVTKTLQFINIKINSASGEIESHQAIELIDRKK